MSRLMLTEEVAELLRVAPDSVREWVAEGRIKAVRLRPRGRLLFDPAEVQAALRQARRPRPAAASCAWTSGDPVGGEK
jgi:excisionase family DNA binding protein